MAEDDVEITGKVRDKLVERKQDWARDGRLLTGTTADPDKDRLPPGQRLVKENMFNMQEEMFEASYTLKNKMHRLTDVRVYDRAHYVEELGDAWAFFMEICLLSGITPVRISKPVPEKVRRVVLLRARRCSPRRWFYPVR